MLDAGLRYSRRALTRLLLLVTIRRGVLSVLLIAVSVPAALLTAYSMVPLILVEEAGRVAILAGGGESSRIAAYGAANVGECLEVYVAGGAIRAGDRSASINVIAMDAGTAQKLLGRYEVGEAPLLLVGSTLSSNLNIGAGSKVELCLGSTCMQLSVSGVVGGRGLFSLSAVLVYADGSAKSFPGNPYYVCRESADVGLRSVISSLGESLGRVSTLLSILTLLVYAPVNVAGIERALQRLEPDIKVLHGVGTPLKALRRLCTAVLAVLGALMALYGVCLGTLAVHVSLWALRFFNIFVESRPAPEAGPATMIVLLLASLNALIASAKCRGLRGDHR